MLVAVGATGCTVNRPEDPVVLNGAQVPALQDVTAGDVVAFRWIADAWHQVPVQVDERKLVQFADIYGPDRPVYVIPGATTTVYADPDTFTGADGDADVDSDDELALMAKDLGARRPDNAAAPPGVVGDLYTGGLGLADGYWRPSYHYLRLHWHLAAEDAEDAVQAFFTTAFEKRYVEAYDPSKAKFRTFLRTCLDRFVQNRQKADRALKRGGETDMRSLDFPGAERELAEHLVCEVQDVDRFFRDETIRALFTRTVDEMRARYAAEGRDAVFLVFEKYDLHAARHDPDTARTYADVGRELGLSTTQVTNHLHAARRRFRELALVNLRALVGTEEEFRVEARELFGLEVTD